MKAVIDIEGITVNIEYHEEKQSYEVGGSEVIGWATIITKFEGDGFGTYGDTHRNIEEMINKYRLDETVESIYSIVEDKIDYLNS